MTTDVNTTTTPTVAAFSAQFVNIRTTLAGKPCQGDRMVPTDMDVRAAYQQAAEWAASDFYGEVAVDCWLDDANYTQVPLWHRRGKTLARTGHPLPAGVAEAVRSIGGAA